MTQIRILGLLAFLLIFGCISQPKPLNETGFLPPIKNLTGLEQSTDNLQQPLQPSEVSMVCSMSGIVNQSTMKIYIKGTSVRSESPDPNTNGTYITIIRNNRYYMSGGQEGSPFENCTWVVFDTSKYQSGNYSNRTASGNFPPIQPGKPQCKSAPVNDSLFNIAGTICDFEKTMETYNSTDFDCSTIADAKQRADCERTFG